MSHVDETGDKDTLIPTSERSRAQNGYELGNLHCREVLLPLNHIARKPGTLVIEYMKRTHGLAPPAVA